VVADGPPVVVAIVGPPAVGKTTLATRLACTLAARVIRLRDLARAYTGAHPDAAALFATTDPLGWWRDDTVAFLLHEALTPDQAPRRLTVLDATPRNSRQLVDLSDLTDALHLPLLIVELVAPDELLWHRMKTRRVCPTCEPDPRDHPRRPAHALPSQPWTCAVCGGVLLRRAGDRPTVFAARLRRYHGSVEPIRRHARGLPLRYWPVDATRAPATVAAAVLAATYPPGTTSGGRTITGRPSGYGPPTGHA
jgi:adenylate kinase family enzyme